MKKTFVIKAIAAIFATAMMSFTTATEASAQNTFVYGQDGNTMTVSTLNRCQREPGGKESLSLECR